MRPSQAFRAHGCAPPPTPVGRAETRPGSDRPGTRPVPVRRAP
jgi:hypothetical protein